MQGAPKRFLRRGKSNCGKMAVHVLARILPHRRQLLHFGTRIIACIVFLTFPFFIYNLYVNSMEMSFLVQEVERMGVYLSASPLPSNGCTIPQYDPFDEGALKFVFPYAPVDCGQQQPYLTYVDADGCIHVNASGAREAGLRPEDVECSYAAIRRRARSDDDVDYETQRVFRDGEQLPAPFVRVKCLRRSDGRVVYETAHAWVAPPTRDLAKRVKAANALRPSVLVIGVDSMSRLNFIRQLPRTHALITDTFGATVFTGLVKVGDNTYPNMFTMLTGMAARKKSDIYAYAWGSEKAYGYFDDLPLVWKNFSENGYLTMYAEDKPVLSAFNYLAKGFVHEPTDYYMRPFWLTMEEITNFRSGDERCYGNIPTYKYLFNYTRDFTIKMRDKRYFAFTFLTGYSHNSINEVQVIETELYELLAELHHSGSLNNTVLVILGDHGNRYDAIRTTVVGRVEERMPYLAIALPPDLRAASPYLEDGLRSNRDSFISWYDVYEMLADVALDNLQPASRVVRWGQLGFSLFRAVPTRSCAEAGVPWDYCVCVREHSLRTEEPVVWTAARALVAHVNALLQERHTLSTPAGAAPCAALALADVLSAQLLLPAKQVQRPQGFTVDVRVAVRVTPSQALLEGTVARDAWHLDGRVKGEVARINKYGNQSHCMRDNILRLYCYCTDLLPGA